MRRAVLAAVLLLAAASAAGDPVVVASKKFNESYLLAEIIAQHLEAQGVPVERRFGLGGTLVCYQALRNGEIDLYVEYSGTLARAILGLPADTGPAALDAAAARQGLERLPPFGFNNSYALVLKDALAEDLGLERISDLRGTDLRLAFSHEFLERDDGWPGLAARYGFEQRVGGIDHGLAYQAIEDGAIDVTDGYTTDGEIPRYGLRALEDDLGFFPAYLAAPLLRRDDASRLGPLLIDLAGTLDDREMQRLNAEVSLEKRSFAEVAAEFLEARGLQTAEAATPGAALWRKLRHNIAVHLQLTVMALGLAIVVGLGLALAVYRSATLSRIVVYSCGLMQTIPSIALLALMIPLFGIGTLPAVVALFLYSLLPIVRNTLSALTAIDPVLERIAVATGMTQAQRLRIVYVPLALPSILAGVRTAAVISIGTATLAAFIGAGGLGDPIVTGLALNDTGLILQGAVPAALLAVLTELLFEGVERRLVPAHMRQA
jgi:osmoprotectant transport system permease protein